MDEPPTLIEEQVPSRCLPCHGWLISMEAGPFLKRTGGKGVDVAGGEKGRETVVRM